MSDSGQGERAAEAESTVPLRTGVERSMTATLTVAAFLLLVLAVPGFADDHPLRLTSSVVAPLILAGLMLVPLARALFEGPDEIRVGLWTPVLAYVGLLGLEAFHGHGPLPDGSVPWLVGLALIAFSCTAVAEENPARAAAICGAINTALAFVYAGRFPVGHNLLEFVGLGLLAAALIAGVRALRTRADQADAAETLAQRLFEDHQREVATEAERVQTDALLHDTVLATLLSAAGGDEQRRITSMARSALQIVSDRHDPHDVDSAIVPFGRALSAADRDFAAFREVAHVDFTAAQDIRIPAAIADALTSATLQALTNSVKHAGPSAHRTAVATRVDGGGVRIVVSDDGAGFETEEVAPERLGVRVSILERVRLAGGSATIRSAPGRGTTLTLAWHPTSDTSTVPRRPGETLLDLIPRRQLYRILGTVIVLAVLIATVDAVLVTHAYASVAASALGLFILPTLIRGARRGTISDRAAWATTAISCLLCSIATIGLDPSQFDSVTASRYTCGVLAGAVMGWMAGRRLPPVIAVGVLLAQIVAWAGPNGVIQLGLAGEIVVVIAALLMHHGIRRLTAAARVAADHHRELAIRQAELDAVHVERHRRLEHASRTAAPMLQHIVEAHGDLDDRSRGDCRVLEQALRDEIRGRHLLNDAVRRIVSTHRRRGALVQVLDDGGLDEDAPEVLETLLDDVARHLESIGSSRIVIRTGHADSDTAVTIVASTPDETAAALGLDADDGVDLWVNIRRPAFSAAHS